MKYTLYVIPGSHPSLTARLMLDYKGIDYRRVDLVPAIHRPIMRAAGFSGATVPALKADGHKVQSSIAIADFLESSQPTPRLYPEDELAAAKVRQAQQWGESKLQTIPRKLLWWAFKHDGSTMASFAGDAKLGLPVPLLMKASWPVIRIQARFNKASDENVQALLTILPGMLNRVDDLIAEGTLAGEELNAADFQIGTSLQLLNAFEDLRPLLAGRPASELAQRVAPDYPGRVGQVFPREWLNAV